MANITICLMVIADLAKSGRSVFSWAVIADLSFESSLRFARAEYFHICSLCSRLWSRHSHQATFICSSPLFTKILKIYSFSILDWDLTPEQFSQKLNVEISCFWQLLILYWWRHDHTSMWWRMCPPDRDITGHYWTLVVMAVTTGK